MIGIRTFTIYVALSCLGIAPLRAAESAVDWPVLAFSQITTNTFSSPTCITHAGDGSGRLFVLEQDGVIRIIQSSNVLTEPFLILTNRVLRWFEQGLLGLAFPPNFSSNHHFYVNYTRKPDGATVISRFSLTADSNLADASSEAIIKIIPQPYANHNGGQIAFGPDGYLYIGMGDGGSGNDPQNNAQNPASLLGKILRLDVEGGASPYAIPTNNPFIGNTNYAPEIWALGLRNPWRFSFDRLTGDLYIGDVGEMRWEEINFQPAGSVGGQNYGWRIVEGPSNNIVPFGFTNFSGLTQPVTSYDHYYGASVTGGYVYRGGREPRMDGIYFFGDFMFRQVLGLKLVGTNWQRVELARTQYPISTFGEDEQGGLYFADYFGGGIYQIQDSRDLWRPSFSPPGGTLNSNTVTVSCLSTGVVIHYTDNGLDPTESDPSVASGGTIYVNNGATNKLRAFRAGFLPSAVTSTTFTLKVAPITFNPRQGPISNGTLVDMSTSTSDAVIHYTLNGAMPDTNSPIYTEPMALNGDTLLTARAYRVGFIESDVRQQFFSLAAAAPLSLTPSAGPVGPGTAVSIFCPTPQTVIRYTLDGTEPTTNSFIYDEPLTINVPTTLRARAFRADLGPSAVSSVFYGLLILENTVVTTLAGTPSAGNSNGVGALAQFSSPYGIWH